MFKFATSFNQPLDAWKTGQVTSMDSMFWNATRFNQPLSSWDTANVTNMSRMFREACSFNQTLDAWDMSKVTVRNDMFFKATAYTPRFGVHGARGKCLTSDHSDESDVMIRPSKHQRSNFQ